MQSNLLGAQKCQHRLTFSNKSSSSSMYGHVILSDFDDANTDSGDHDLYEKNSITSDDNISDYKKRKRRRKKLTNKEYFNNKKLIIKSNDYQHSHSGHLNNQDKIKKINYQKPSEAVTEIISMTTFNYDDVNFDESDNFVSKHNNDRHHQSSSLKSITIGPSFIYDDYHHDYHHQQRLLHHSKLTKQRQQQPNFIDTTITKLINNDNDPNDDQNDIDNHFFWNKIDQNPIKRSQIHDNHPHHNYHKIKKHQTLFNMTTMINTENEDKKFLETIKNFGLINNNEPIPSPIPFSNVLVSINSRDQFSGNSIDSSEVDFKQNFPILSSSSSSSSLFESFQSNEDDESVTKQWKKHSNLFAADGSNISGESSSSSSSEEIEFQHSLVAKDHLFDIINNKEIDLPNQNSKSHFYVNDSDEWNIHHFIKNEDNHYYNDASLMKSNRPPRYVLSGHHPNINITWPVKKVAEVHGNITLGGLMMVHEREDQKICGPIMPQGGIQALEAMLHTIDYVNSQSNILPGITLGAYILDDCDKDTYGLEQSIDFIKGSITNLDDSYSCSDGSTRSQKQKRIWGVLGAASSATSIQVANLLRLFRIPQVSFFSTSSELSNKQRFEYFLRTVPNDKSQAMVIVEIVKRLNWSYVSIIYEESIYGIRAFNDLEELLEQTDICIAIKERLTKDSGIAANSSYDNIVRKLGTKPNSKGVIVFGSDQEVAMLMQAVKRNNATGQFYWIGSDGWSARKLVYDGNEHQVEGTISVQPMASPVPGFYDYFFSLTPQNNHRNPWFIEYWEHTFKCKWPNSDYTPYNLEFEKNCTGNERTMSADKESDDDVEMQLQFVSDAVLSFAYAIQSMQRELCSGTRGVCPRMLAADGSQLLQHLRAVQFKGMTGHEFHFAENGDGPGRYRIIHFKQVDKNKFDWIQVGEYVDGNLNINLSKVQFRLSDPDPPISVCSQPCDKGQAKSFLEGEKCCFHCINCTKYQILVSETQCIDCPSGFLPDSEQIECIAIPEEYMRPDSSWSVGALVFACIGIVFTIFVIIIFIRYNDTPVVRASGRELCYVLLIGILICYSMTLFLVQKPTIFICGAQKAGIGLCFSVVYSAILTKTNRISRIFKAGKRSARRPSFISPKSQLLICGGFIMIQCFIIAIWFAFSPPKVIYYHPTREDNKLICQASINAGYFVAFMYPIFLIVVCTVYAVITRNIPEAFNESKFIGFTMYTTCIIWLAFVPIYFTSSQSNHIALNLTTLSVSISLSATVTLLCLFSPKLYIILLHPEKNIRQSVTMPQHKYSTTIHHHHNQQQQQSNQKTVSMTPTAPPSSSSSNTITAAKPTIQSDPLSTTFNVGGTGGGQNAVLKMKRFNIQNDNSNNIVEQQQPTINQVDSSTQSDEYEMSEVMIVTASGGQHSKTSTDVNHLTTSTMTNNGNIMAHHSHVYYHYNCCNSNQHYNSNENRRDSTKSLPPPMTTNINISNNNNHHQHFNNHRCRCVAATLMTTTQSQPNQPITSPLLRSSGFEKIEIKDQIDQNNKVSKGTQTVLSMMKNDINGSITGISGANVNTKVNEITSTVTATAVTTVSPTINPTYIGHEIEQF
ncbi:metabotropic glutamate receptor 8-like isoform x1 [Dermatophagoides farinae]|uniref:Metabotropic glutamate receptor 8-like isoform x1 n=1 Tax=Dermatophagoides farinae TaxID=6954 RepID=A0A9D4P0W7_DERFA|nr:metabotropic glutamate receptor 8-like isoform x1 [Dermatophagoides farinae]